MAKRKKRTIKKKIDYDLDGDGDFDADDKTIASKVLRAKYDEVDGDDIVIEKDVEVYEDIIVPPARICSQCGFNKVRAFCDNCGYIDPSPREQ